MMAKTYEGPTQFGGCDLTRVARVNITSRGDCMGACVIGGNQSADKNAAASLARRRSSG